MQFVSNDILNKILTNVLKGYKSIPKKATILNSDCFGVFNFLTK